MRCHVLMHDGKSDAAAAHRPLRLALAPVERLEDALPVCRCHAVALVMEINADIAGKFNQFKADAALERRISDGVGQQIGHRRANFLPVQRNFDALADHRYRQLARPPLQPLRIDLFFNQLQQIDALPMQLTGLESGSVEAQQVLDLLLQECRVVTQDLRDLALLVAQRTSHAVFEQRHAFAHGCQRRFQLMRNMAQKARFVGVQLDQPQPQPVQPLAHQCQVGRALNGNRLVQPVFTQANDGVFQPPQRQREPDAEGHRHRYRQCNRPAYLLGQELAAAVEPGFQRFVASLNGLLHL